MAPVPPTSVRCGCQAPPSPSRWGGTMDAIAQMHRLLRAPRNHLALGSAASPIPSTGVMRSASMRAGSDSA